MSAGNTSGIRTVAYRGFVIERAPFGHWNVSRGDGFCGGFGSLAEAKGWVDNRFWSVERVELDDGRVGYRVARVEAQS